MGFLSFTKSMCKNLSNKYCHKLLDSVKKLTTTAIRAASKRLMQTKAEATGDLIDNKIADKITSASKSTVSSQNNDTNNETNVPKKHIYLQKNDNKLLMN